MRHPFANVQCYGATSSDADNFNQDSEYLPLSSSPSLPSDLGHVRLASPMPSAGFSICYFLRRSSEVTVQLACRESHISGPVYHTGETIDGIVTLTKPSGIQSLTIGVYGLIKIKEIAGSGALKTQILRDNLYQWDSQRDAPIPSQIPVQYTLPQDFRDEVSDRLRPLPPSYDALMSGIHGFTAQVLYGFIVHMVRTERKAPSWQRRSRFRVPFLLQQYTRPFHAGPFCAMPMKALTGPQTLFTFGLEARHSGRTYLETHVFLPSSQICSLKEPIPFFVTVFADEESLAPFASYRPSPASFHPLSSSPPSALNNMQRQLMRTNESVSPLRIRLRRTTTVNTLREANTYIATNGHLVSTRSMGQGVVHNTTKGPNSITWSGTITVAAGIGNGGFITDALGVTDSIVVSIRPPDASRLQYMTFCETIPVFLTTESHDCPSAAAVTVLPA